MIPVLLPEMRLLVHLERLHYTGYESELRNAARIYNSPRQQ